MWQAMAGLLVRVVEVYMGAGLLFAVPFVLRGAGAVDPDARRGSVGFRLLVLPGVVALWPVLAYRWRRGGPPQSGSTAHDLPARPEITAETLVIRACGTAALLLLHVILSIGPFCRLDRRFLPLLYNRRHMGVTMFALAAVHGLFSIVQFHAFGVENPLVSVLTGNGRYDSLAWFPFQPLGLAALTILFLMAATSHDFWLAVLTPPQWKALHMLVYVAYGPLVMHVDPGVAAEGVTNA